MECAVRIYGLLAWSAPFEFRTISLTIASPNPIPLRLVVKSANNFYSGKKWFKYAFSGKKWFKYAIDNFRCKTATAVYGATAVFNGNNNRHRCL